jgi:hypothetical protein
VGALAVGGLVVSLPAARPAPAALVGRTAAAPVSVQGTARPGLPVRRASEPPTRPAPREHRTGADPAGAATATQAAPAAVGSPAAIRIRAVGIHAPIRPVGVATDGQLALPPDPDVVGWYRHGPRPGAGRGGAVLASHVDTLEEGLGVFARLTAVRRGDAVLVTTRDGHRRTYRVSAVRRYDKQSLPARLFARTGPERLHLITCGGEFDADRGGYQQNLVVTALPS